MMDISAVIPAFNEEGNIEASVAGVCSALGRLAGRYEVIVVDDGSSDRTPALVEGLARGNAAVRLIRHPGNQGYGKALSDGFAAAAYSHVFFTDADLQFDMAELGGLLPLAAGNDLVCGYRVRKKYGFGRRASSFCYNLLVRLVLRPGVRDVNCAFKLIKKEALSALRPRSAGFFVSAELLARARRLGYKVAEAPVSHFPRPTGESKVRPDHIFGTLREMFSFLLGGG